jgi:hypothetical protein
VEPVQHQGPPATPRCLPDALGELAGAVQFLVEWKVSREDGPVPATSPVVQAFNWVLWGGAYQYTAVVSWRRLGTGRFSSTPARLAFDQRERPDSFRDPSAGVPVTAWVPPVCPPF